MGPEYKYKIAVFVQRLLPTDLLTFDLSSDHDAGRIRCCRIEAPWKYFWKQTLISMSISQVVRLLRITSFPRWQTEYRSGVLSAMRGKITILILIIHFFPLCYSTLFQFVRNRFTRRPES